jgi:hypothetical protein
MLTGFFVGLSELTLRTMLCKKQRCTVSQNVFHNTSGFIQCDRFI